MHRKEKIKMEIRFLDLACAKLTQETHEPIDPDSLIKVRDTGESLVIITEEGKKHIFTFEELEDFYQYLEDQRSETTKEASDQRSETTKEAPDKPEPSKPVQTAKSTPKPQQKRKAPNKPAATGRKSKSSSSTKKTS